MIDTSFDLIDIGIELIILSLYLEDLRQKTGLRYTFIL